MISKTKTPTSLSLVLVFYCAASGLAAWSASLAGRLASPATVWGLLIFYGILLIWLSEEKLRLSKNIGHKSFRRFRRLLPACFLGVATLIFLGAIIHHPSNYDHLSYRFPRILNWWSEGAWHWITTNNSRQNLSGVGFEWAWSPFFLLFKSDWAAVGLNLTAFFLLPGQLFRCLRLMGVRGKIAYAWMWILPCGYGFVAQAGSAGNDLFGAFLFLVAFNAACRGFKTAHGYTNFAVSLLASALMTSIKFSNLPLLLPIAAVYAFQTLRIFSFARKRRLLFLLFTGVAVSGVPLISMNIWYTGAWTGDPANNTGVAINSPVAGVTGNTLQLLVGTISPPINPISDEWNSMWPDTIPRSLKSWLEDDYPRFRLDVRELLGEEDAGLGIGIIFALMCTFLLGGVTSRGMVNHSCSGLSRNVLIAVSVATWISFAVLLAKLGSENIARLALPYYPILFATILPFAGEPSRLNRWRFFKITSALSIISVLPMIILTPSRPLFPWKWVGDSVLEGSPFQDRFISVYSVYSERWDAFRPAKELISGKPDVVGLISTGDDPEVSLWRPFGSTRVQHILPSTPGDQWPEVVVTPDFMLSDFQNIEEHFSMETVILNLKASKGSQNWIVLQRIQ